MKKSFLILSVLMLCANAQAALVTTNTPNMCAFLNTSVTAHAVFESDEFVCSAGEYLPANTRGCVSCPNNAICNGGTYMFNASFAQGIIYPDVTADNIQYGCDGRIQKLSAIFDANEHTCAPGEYLPANIDACTKCPENHYCTGGTYTFDENAVHGLTACDSGLFAPAGSSSVTQCTHVLRIGDKHIYLHTTKQTSPSLYIDIDNDGVADYYANATNQPVPISAEYENEINGNKMLIEISDNYVDSDGKTITAGNYYIYDNTITLPE